MQNFLTSRNIAKRIQKFQTIKCALMAYKEKYVESLGEKSLPNFEACLESTSYDENSIFILLS